MKHTIYKGSCIDRLKDIPEGSVQLVISSPPYYNAKEYNGEPDNIGNNKDYPEYLDRIDRVIKGLKKTLVDGGIVCWNTSPVICDGFRYMIPYDHHKLFIDNGFVCRDSIVWKKPDGCAAPRSGGWFQNKGIPLTWHPNTVYEHIMVYQKPGNGRFGKNKSINYHYPKGIPKDLLTDVWFMNPETNTTWHDAPFGPELVKRCIVLFSFEGETVLDPFAGSFSVSLGARQLGRNSIGIEIADEYIRQAKEKMGWYQKGLFNDEIYEEK